MPRSRPRAARLLPALLLVALGACQPFGSPQSSAGASRSGAPDLTPSTAPPCAGDEHALAEEQLGWAFCYPASWRFRERDQSSPAPPGVDSTFDVTVAAPQQAGVSPGPDQGKFAFMIISTYQREGTASLAEWVRANLPDGVELQGISWGNARDAAQIAGSRRRLALTAHHVVLLDIREGEGNLDLDSEMGKRLQSWRFDY